MFCFLRVLPSEFPVTFYGMGKDIFWDCTPCFQNIFGFTYYFLKGRVSQFSASLYSLLDYAHFLAQAHLFIVEGNNDRKQFTKFFLQIAVRSSTVEYTVQVKNKFNGQQCWYNLLKSSAQEF